MASFWNRINTVLLLLVLLVVIGALASRAWGGPLDPPAPPGPTQETQINSCPFTIGSSGSYVLTHELVCPAGSDGITVSAPNVAIDMKGFALVGPGGLGAETGISTAVGSAHLSVRNGTIRDWGGRGLNNTSTPGEFTGLTFDHVGFNGYDGVDLDQATISDCVIKTSGTASLSALAAQNSSIVHCEFWHNPGIGLTLATNSTASNVTAADGLIGILLNNNSTLTDSTASGNLGDGVEIASGNTISRTTAVGNVGYGIKVAGNGNHLTGNNASFNHTGINVGGYDNHVEGNVTSDNSVDGIAVSLAHNDIKDNNASSNGVGIYITGADTTVEGNSTSHNNNCGIETSGGVSNRITGNHLADNDVTGGGSCPDIFITGGGNWTVVANNSVETTRGVGGEGFELDAPWITAYQNNYSGPVSIGHLGYNVTANCTNCDFGPGGLASSSTSPWANIVD